MTRSCAVKSCGHRQGSKIKDGCTFSKFSKDVDRCRRWIQAVGDHDLLELSLEIISKDRFVCSCHFNDNDYSITKNKKQIKPSAVPVQFSSNVAPLTGEEMLKFPPSTDLIIPRMRIKMPTSELNNLIQPKKHGILNPIYVQNSESKQLQELSFASDDEPMIVEGLTSDLPLSIPSFTSSPLSPSNSKIVEKSPSRSFYRDLGNSSEINMNDQSKICLKRKRKSSNDASTSSNQTGIVTWNKENLALKTPPSNPQRSQYQSESMISSKIFSVLKLPILCSNKSQIKEKDMSTVQQHVESCTKIVVPREQWLLFKRINFLLENLKAADSNYLLSAINNILKPYERSNYSRSYVLSNLKASSLKRNDNN